MAQNVTKDVLPYILDTWSVMGLWNLIAVNLGVGVSDDTDLPINPNPTVRDGATRSAPAAITQAGETCPRNRDRMTDELIPKPVAEMVLRGNYMSARSASMGGVLSNDIDVNLVADVERVAASNIYTGNGVSAATASDFRAAEAGFYRAGFLPQNRVYVCNPGAEAVIKSFGSDPIERKGDGFLGVPEVARLNGIPVYTSPLVAQQGGRDVAYLIDRSKVFVKVPSFPEFFEMKDLESSGWVLQASILYGVRATGAAATTYSALRINVSA